MRIKDYVNDAFKILKDYVNYAIKLILNKIREHGELMDGTVWLAGRRVDNWEINGVFSTKEKAVNACTAYCDFIMPLKLDEVAPEETTIIEVEWPNIKEE